MNIEKSLSYFYALIIKAVLVFVLRLFVRMNWMRNFNWDSDKSKLAKDKSNLTSANLSCTWQFQLEEVTTCKLKKTLSIEKVSKWVGNSPILSGNPVLLFFLLAVERWVLIMSQRDQWRKFSFYDRELVSNNISESLVRLIKKDFTSWRWKYFTKARTHNVRPNIWRSNICWGWPWIWILFW